MNLKKFVGPTIKCLIIKILEIQLIKKLNKRLILVIKKLVRVSSAGGARVFSQRKLLEIRHVSQSQTSRATFTKPVQSETYTIRYFNSSSIIMGIINYRNKTTLFLKLIVGSVKTLFELTS